MIGKSGKHYNNPNVARSMGDAPDEDGPDAGGEPHEDTVIELHKTRGGLKTKQGGEEKDHADFDALVAHLKAALGAEGDGDGGHGLEHESPTKPAAKSTGGVPLGGGLSALGTL